MKIAFNIARGIVLILAFFFIVMGMQWLFVPQNLASDFALIPNGILGWATIRADLGSLFLVTGITAALAASNNASANAYLFCGCLLMSVAALGRAIGFVIDGVPAGGVTPFIFELCVVAALVGLATTRARLDKGEAAQ